MTVKELQSRAKELKIRGFSRMTKPQLEAAITAADRPTWQSVETSVEEVPTPPTIRPMTVEEVGQSSLDVAARYLRHLTDSNGGRKNIARNFRKALRRAGYFAHAGVDVNREYAKAA